MRRLGAAVTAIVVLGLAACSSDDDNSGNGNPGAAPTNPAPSTSDAPNTQPASTTTTLAPNLDAVSLGLQQVASGLDSPVALAWRADDQRVYVAEQGGTVRVIGSDGQPAGTPVVEIAVSHGNEQGLLGLDFSADGSKLYVNYTDPAGDSHVVEYTMDGDVVDESSRRELLFVEDRFPNHNGGQVTVNPDGTLFIGFGDGGSGGDPDENAQNRSVLLGKILRINPAPAGASPYSIPDDNPFVGQAGARGEIWHYGLRNPWRFSIDRVTGDMWIGDVGQSQIEEIDFAPAGEKGTNWGWDEREGTREYEGPRQPGMKDPITENSRDNGECAIVGGHVYRGTSIPDLYGVYLWGDNCASPILGGVQRDGEMVEERVIGSVESLTTFGEDKHGELYVASRNGEVYRLTEG
jgi:glucose/arabinose dehydrogenase